MKDHSIIIKAAVRLFVSVASSSLFIFQALAQNQPLPLIEVTPPIQLTPNFGANQNVTDFKISPNNEHVVYIADQNNDDVFELYSARMDGSTPPIKLSIANPVSDGDVKAIGGFTSDGQSVVFLANQERADIDQIYSAKLDGSSRIILTPASTVATAIIQFTLSHDGSRVLYAPFIGGGLLTKNQLYSVSSTGGEISRLTDNFPLSTDLIASDLNISPDGSKVVYRVTTNGREQLHVANIDGAGTSVRVDQSGNGQGLFIRFLISSDNSRVVYMSDRDTSGVFELYSVNTDGSPSSFRKLNSPLAPDADVADFRINSLNSSFVYYIAPVVSLEQRDVFSVSINGGASTQLTPTFANRDESRAAFTNNAGAGEIVPYTFLDRGLAGEREFSLRGIRQSDNGSILISASTRTFDLSNIAQSNSGTLISFTSRDFGSFISPIYSMRVSENATSDRTLISGPQSMVSFRSQRAISLDDRIVSYTEPDVNDDSLQNLYVTSFTRGQPVRVNQLATDGTKIDAVLVSDNSRFVVYRSNTSSNNNRLMSAEITINEPESDGDLCVPIQTPENNVAVVCL